jgi:Na+-transporting NADH:ubiquinone oxidoreductase subunit C
MSDTVSKDNTLRALGVALAVAFVCALLVSVVAVSLRPVHRANIEAERIAQLELVLAALSDIGRAQTIDSLEARLVDLETGAFDDSTDPTAFDADRAASKPATSVAIPAELDLAGLKRRALLAQVYLVRGSGNAIDLIILPVSGRAPGVGARIEEPEWEAQWRDLSAYDDDGVLRIGVRSHGAGYSDDAQYQVDGISGATRTAQGVDGMLRFWLGDFGFEPFLQRIREDRL